MSVQQSKRMTELEHKLQETQDNPVRHHVLEAAKDFKNSWIELGRALYSVWKDKLYKEWGYTQFDTYTAREIGIRKQTAMKLLRSYYFLEKEEPDYLANNNDQGAQEVNRIPSYEAVNLLRMAKNNKELDSKDYAALKKEVFEAGKDTLEVKKDLTSLIRQRKELEPEEARQERRVVVVKRFLSTLKSLKIELESSKFLSATITKDVEAIIKRVESEL